MLEEELVIYIPLLLTNTPPIQRWTFRVNTRTNNQSDAWMKLIVQYAVGMVEQVGVWSSAILL